MAQTKLGSFAEAWARRKAEGGPFAALQTAWEAHEAECDRIQAELNRYDAAVTEINRALLGLPLAHRTTPVIRNAEDRLTHIMTAMTKDGGGLEINRELLDEITSLAARVEAEAAIA